ncbi:molybdopterin converting factor subunit 1 [Halalkalibacter urbisdiaboli]|uniref:molybdopterin converting factor subunit 1 n=1 Tax=Halalkalibacter urbisdiaboli TaxID=1960589 RepID=UPI000B43E8F6|nr:molybdopterin converting factor subunit 1 [Halalkalibacter urbisdiaboli]
MIRVLLFADLGEIAGQRDLSIELETGTVDQVKAKLQEQYPAMELDQAMVAINEEYAEPDTPVKTGDIVAFIPPVSGG